METTTRRQALTQIWYGCSNNLDRFEMKSTLVGHSNFPGVAREGKILNRIIRATANGWEYECDPRHIEMLIEQLGLGDSKAAVTPGVEASAAELAGDALQPVDIERAIQYRRLVARANYIASDRAESHYAIKELCREMSAPTELSWTALKSLVASSKPYPVRCFTSSGKSWCRLWVYTPMPTGPGARSPGLVRRVVAICLAMDASGLGLEQDAGDHRHELGRVGIAC